MPDEFLKKSIFASSVEDMLKKESKLDLEQGEFEVDAFIKSLQAESGFLPDAPMQLPQEDFLTRLRVGREWAALSGKFNPDELVAEIRNEKYKKDLLSALAPDCIISPKGTLRWQLGNTMRDLVLQELLSKSALRESLATPLPATDRFGKMLRRVLSGDKKVDPEKLGQEDLLALATVLECLKNIDIGKPDAITVKAMIKKTGLLDEYTSIARDFMGREVELRQLADFVFPSTNNVPPLAWAGLVVTGLGGVGKSALLAEFIRQVLKDKKAVVSILDFDRPGIDPVDRLWMAEEISRQVGEQFPKSRERLSEVRTRIRAEMAQFSVNDPSYSYSLVTDLFLRVADVLKEEAESLPLLLVFDTMEEVCQRNQIRFVAEFMHSVADYMARPGTRAIFSGRLFEGQLREVLLIDQVAQRELPVREFDAEVATAFLKVREVSPILAGKIIRSGLFPLQPLELKLVAKYLEQNKGGLPDLIEELKTGKGKNQAQLLFTGVIYRRVLMRIPDTQIRAIAYPGLILRYITPELILNILVPALDLKGVGVQEAREMANKLGSYTWLAYKDNQNAVWHRKDLRRSMLQLMLAHEPEKALRIREAAIAYFGKMTDPKDVAESVYHRLMGMSGAVLPAGVSIEALESAFNYLSNDLFDFPEEAQVLLKYAAKRPLAPAEVTLLPPVFFKRAYDEAGRKLVSDRQFEEACALYKRGVRIKMDERHEPKDELLDNWEAEALFASAKWADLEKMPPIWPGNVKTITICSLVNYVYPRAIVSPTRINAGDVQEMAFHITVNQLFKRGTPKTDQVNAFSRLAVCLVMLEERKRILPQTKDFLRTILVMVSKLENTPSPTLQKALLLISLVAGQRPPGNISLGLSLMKLDIDWLKSLTSRLDKTQRNPIEEVIGQMTVMARKRVTTRSFLAYLDGDAGRRKALHEVSIALNWLDSEGTYRLLAGPEPLFREPFRQVMTESFRTTADAGKLSMILSKSLPFQIEESDAQRLVSLYKRKEVFMEPLIEIIDRSWALGPVLAGAVQAKPQHKGLRWLKIVEATYQRALEHLISNAVPRRKLK